ncbi:MAG: alkaline phosphatase family protein [Holophagaceae bacterium]|nr:alkaline phosphatase family protein [Holophagaceae bacterium]
MKLLRALACLALACTLSAQARPLPGEARPLSVIAFGSCAEQHRPQPIWTAILAQRPQLFLALGDNIYCDTEDMGEMAKEYERLARIPEFRKFRAAVPIRAIWDDHDFGANDGGRDYPQREASQRLFLEFWKEPAQSPRRRRPGLYDAEVHGPAGRRVQVILLDTRAFRSPLKPRPGGEDDLLGRWASDPDPGSDMLGSAQWAWLEAQLQVPAEVRFIVSSVQVVSDNHGWEKWGNFPTERQRLFDLLKRTGATGVVFLSGDRHFGELCVMDAGLGYPLYDFTSSGLNQGSDHFRYRRADPARVAMQAQGDNFGVVRIDWSRPDPLLRLECRDEQGELRFLEKIPLSLLKGKAPAAAPGTAPTARPPAAAAPEARR